MGNRLYIGNLSWDTTQDKLQAVLTENGRTVKDLHFPMDRETGKPRGFAFAEMGNDAEAQQCIEQMDGMELDGRNLKVNEAQPRPERSGGGGRGGRGGGGGYGGGGGGGDRW